MDCCIPSPLQQRLQKLRQLLQTHNLQAILLSDKQNIFY